MKTTPQPPSPPAQQHAFTLAELMVVISVIALLTALSIPAYQRVASSLDMANAGQLLVSQLDNARQEALASNRTVVIRIYQIPADNSATPALYRAFQSFTTNDDGSLSPAGKVIFLPDAVTISAGEQQSPLLTRSPAEVKSPSPADPPLPNLGNNYRYVSLRFRPNGQLDPKPGLATADWYLTLCRKNPGQVDPARPGDFITISLDPANGRTTTYRP